MNLVLVIAILFGIYGVVFGLIKRLNEWYHVRHLGDKKKSLPPGDMGWPFIGSILPLLKAFQSENPDSYFYDLFKRHGRTGIYKASIFWSPTMMVCLPETCRAVLMDDEKFGMEYLEPSATMIGQTAWEHITTIENRRLRKLMTSSINGHEALSMSIASIEKVVIATLDDWSSRDKPIDLLDAARKLTFKIIARVLLGSSGDSIDLIAMEKCFNGLGHGILNPVANLDLPAFPFRKNVQKKEVLRKIFQGVIDEVRNGKRPRSDEDKGLIDLLLELKYDDGRKLKDGEIIDVLTFLVFAGHDGLAHSLMWSTLLVHKQPEIYQKAKEEQEEVMKRRPPSQQGLTYKEIKEMHYLSKVTDEVLRRSNIAFMLPRRAKVDANINGYLIPKGWRILVWSRAVHMDAKTYTDPQKFLPSRWDNYTPKAGSFIPFGAGSRMCAGNDFAKLEIAILLHHIILNYKFQQMNPYGHWIYLPGPKPKDNCLARFTKLHN